MGTWQLWAADVVYEEIKLIEPQLESWNAKYDPAQIRLQKYLDEIQRELGILPPVETELFLHIDIDVRKEEHLLHHHDLDNYLYPVVHRLGAAHFKFVSATKGVGGVSRIVIGQAKPLAEIAEKENWHQFTHETGSGSVQKLSWRQQLRDAIKVDPSRQLQPGPVEVNLVWRCSSQRNWTSLWKPTIDAMGPILGEPFPNRPFYPNDDRIVSLALHLNIDDGIGWSLYVGMMWRLATTNAFHGLVV
jgi:hypothetical protein